MAQVLEAFLPTALAQNVIHSNLQACMRDLGYCDTDLESAEGTMPANEVARPMSSR